jgi:hypothetical protein
MIEVERALPGGFRTRNATNDDIEDLTKIYEKRYGSIEQAEKHVRDFVEYHGVRLALAESRIVGLLFWMQREVASQGQAEIVDLWVEETEGRNRGPLGGRDGKTERNWRNTPEGVHQRD